MRDFLRNNATLETVVDFGDHQIFAGVTTYPAILTMKAGAPQPGHELRFWKIGEMPAGSFADAFANAVQPFPQAALGQGSWELEGDALRALRAKIMEGKPTLREVYGSPCRGIVSGLNEAFVIDTPTKERLCREDPCSADLLKPFLEGKDLKRWRAEPRGLWIIYIPKNRVRIDDYPAIRDWLLPFKEKLERRATEQEWFELQQAQEAFSEAFSGPKIFYPDLFQGPKFSFDNNGLYPPNTIYAIVSKDFDFFGFLNSKLCWFFLSGISGAMRGGEWRLRLFSQYIEAIPVPISTIAGKLELATLAQSAQSAAEKRYAFQQEITRRISDLAADPANAKLTTRLKEWWTLPNFAAFQREVKKALKADIPLKERSEWEDWISTTRAEIHALTAEIARLEGEINARVYALFDLTPDEIALLEANV